MAPEEIRALVEQGIDDADVAVAGEGDKFQIRVVAAAFDGLMPVRRQQLVYGCINHLISDGSVHAVSMKLYTPEEWQKAQRMGLA